jgi:hypothetical protein
MATITVTPGHTYGTTDTVTSTNLNDLGSPTAALTAGSILTADIADDNVTTAKIADDNVTTAKIADANVTFAKLADVIDDDTMATATDTTLATSESIKVYVDDSSTDGFSPTIYASEESVTLPNGLIMKFGTVTASLNSVTTVTFGSAFTDTVNAQLTIEENSSTDRYSIKINSLSVSALDIRNTSGTNLTVHWMVIGR